MTNESQPLDRREALRFLADTDLPSPHTVGFFDEHGIVTLRFDDNDTAAVIAWVNNPATNPDGAKIRQTEPMTTNNRLFSDYGVDGHVLKLAGWRMNAWTAVDEPAVES